MRTTGVESAHRERGAGMGRLAGGLAAAALLLVGGCEKVRQAVSAAGEAAKAAAAEQAAAAASAAAGGGAGEVRQLAADEFDDFVGRADRLVVIDFHADWCGPCRQLGPVLEEVCGQLGPRVSLGKVNVDHAKPLAAKLGVTAIPDVRVFRGGKQVDAFVGARSRAEIERCLGGQLAKLPPPAEAGTSTAGAESADEPVGTIVPMEKDWLPPGVERR